MRETLSQRNITPFPFVTKQYIDQTVMNMTSEVDNNMIPLLEARTNKISQWKSAASGK